MVNKLTILLAVFSLTAALFIGCGDEGTGPGNVDGIQGTVTYKDGTTPVAGATVTATSTLMEATFATDSGNDGGFKFSDVPDGDYRVTADKGSFHAEGNITVSGGKTTAAMLLALDIDESKIGVVPGVFDDIGSILTDLGYEFTTLTDADLADSTKLDPLELLFLNCGSNTFWASDATVQTNLQNYVNDGGYLYASDWEYVYVETSWPSAVEFYGADPRIGDEQTITADVTDSALAGYLGKNEAEITFDLSDWVVINRVDSSTAVLVRGSFSTTEGQMTDKPLMVSFEHGNGIVAYTCFHNEAQITDDARELLLYFISLT